MRLPWRRKQDQQQHEERFTLDEYAKMLNQFYFNGIAYTTGMQQTIQGNRESIENDLVSYVNAAYKSNGIVFACMLARRSIFTEARFQFRALRRNNGRPGPLFGTQELNILERPFPGGVTADLLARMIDDADLAGNWFGFRDQGEIIRLRPDFVDIVLEPRQLRGGVVGYKKAGYVYYEDGDRGKSGVAFLPDEVAHFAPNPDPLSPWRGMSWLTPIIREVQSDKLATQHKQKFFENGATPNMVFQLPHMNEEQFKQFKEQTDTLHQGVQNAYKNLYVGGGADVTVVGADFQQIDFKSTQGAGETRIAAAAGIHPVIIGLSEGLAGSSLNQGNFNAARRLTADKMLRPLWRNAAASLEQIVRPPAGAELHFDERDVAFLREDQKDVAEIQHRQSVALRQLLDAGYDPDAAVEYLLSDDLSALSGTHSGLFSVQLQPPGTTAEAATAPVRVQLRSPAELVDLTERGWTLVRDDKNENDDDLLELEAA